MEGINFDLDALIGQFMGNVPALIRPQIYAFLRDNGIVWGREFSTDILEIKGGEWRVTCWVMQQEPNALFATCRWINGYLPDSLESVFCRSKTIAGNPDAEQQRMVAFFRQQIERAL